MYIFNSASFFGKILPWKKGLTLCNEGGACFFNRRFFQAFKKKVDFFFDLHTVETLWKFPPKSYEKAFFWALELSVFLSKIAWRSPLSDYWLCSLHSQRKKQAKNERDFLFFMYQSLIYQGYKSNKFQLSIYM